MRPSVPRLTPRLRPAPVRLTEMRDGSAPPQPDEPRGAEERAPPSRLRRLGDFLLALLWF